MKRLIAGSLLILLVALGCFLSFYPTAVDPVAWTPPAAEADRTLELRQAEALAVIEPLGSTGLPGPEAFVVDRDGFLIAGLADGRVVRTSRDGRAMKTLAQTGGRPLGLAWHPDGRLLIADAKKGVLALTLPDGQITVLHAADHPTLPLRFTDDLAVSSDGRYAYVSDASQRWGYGQDTEAVLEHRADGRLIRLDLSTGEATVLLDDLAFANGVALSPAGDFVLVNETAAYQVRRYWLSGPRAGSQDVWLAALPGFPDNIRIDAEGLVWIALFAPRNALMDALAPYPRIRQAVARALTFLPRPVAHHSLVIAATLAGQPVLRWEASGASAYAPITTVLRVDQQLIVGSLTQDHLGTMAAEGVNP